MCNVCMVCVVCLWGGWDVGYVMRVVYVCVSVCLQYVFVWCMSGIFECGVWYVCV